jgi:glycosyltransferase involved in cell wall biosynthesis
MTMDNNILKSNSISKALIHENYYTYGGAEKVVESLTNIDPTWDHFSLTDHASASLHSTVLKDRKPQTSFIQSLPFSKSKFRHYFPLFPYAIESFDLRKYDLILSSSASVAKGCLVHSDQLHICYMHSPVRYAWDLYFQYLESAGLRYGFKGTIAKFALHHLRNWDIASSMRPDVLIANSNYIARRIQKIYRRPSKVIYPPVDTTRFQASESSSNYYVTSSRFVPYKKIDLIAEAFSNMGKKLVIIGDGPDKEKIKQKASKVVEFTGYLPDQEMISVIAQARAYVFAACEDFGIAPVEAQACGIPVIAYGVGGASESIRGLLENEVVNPQYHTGVFFQEQSVSAISDAVSRFEAQESSFLKTTIIANADRFSKKRFESEMSEFISDIYADFLKNERKNFK